MTRPSLYFESGEAAQVDFGAGPILEYPDGGTRRTWAFVMTQCHSRHQYVEFLWDQTVATWLGCHRRAFEWFAGVPQPVIIDNAQFTITMAYMHDMRVQGSYAECDDHFRIDTCPPHDSYKNGVVEASVKYVKGKGNFLPLCHFRDLADLNAQARTWVMGETGQRCHGTTPVAPLQLLPDQAPDLGSWHQVSVHRDCHVKFNHCLYSAPFSWVGKALWLRTTDTSVSLFHDHLLVASHARSLRPGQRMTVHDHMPPKAQWFFAHDRQ